MPRADHSVPLVGTSVEATGSSRHRCADARHPTVVYATPLANPSVLLAVPVPAAGTTEQLSVQAEGIRQDTGDGPRSVAAAAHGPATAAPARFGDTTADPAAGSRSSRPRLAVRAPVLRRACQACEQRRVCMREGIRMCECCKTWVCSEHSSALVGAPGYCKACARNKRGGGAPRYECLESRCQALLCSLVCVALFVLFYLGPYRDGRK